MFSVTKEVGNLREEIITMKNNPVEILEIINTISEI